MPASRANHKRVLIPIYYYYPYVSGLSIYARQNAEGLVKEGYEVTVLTSLFDKDLKKSEMINGVKVVRRPVLLKLGKGVIMPLFWFDIARYAARNDYVNSCLPLADSGVSSLFIPKRKMITPYVCDIYLGPGRINKIVEAVSMFLMRVQLMRSSVVVPLSLDYLCHSKMKRFIKKAQAISPAIATAEFKPVKYEALFKHLGVSGKDIKIGFVGRIVYEKGIKYLLEAIPYLYNELVVFKIIIVGDYEKVAGGSIKDELDHYMEKYPDNILFTGYLNDEDRNKFYSGLDVLVLPSIDPLEAFGMVQVEAMLCGTPVVATNLPGVREVVNKSGYGRISKIKDPKDIAQQIIEVVNHPKKYQPNRDKLVRLFDANQSIKRFTELMPKR